MYSMTEAQLTKSATILAAQDNVFVDKRKPSSPPAPLEGEEMKDYVLKLHDDCPVEQIELFGIVSVPKKLIPRDATLQENRGKMIFPKVLVRLLSESQVKALLERAKETPIWVPEHRDFNDVNKRVPEYRGFASEWIIIEEVDRAKTYEVPTLQKQEEKLDVVQEASTQLFREQIDRAEKRKK